jgi:hypothetical protein
MVAQAAAAVLVAVKERRDRDSTVLVVHAEQTLEAQASVERG